MHSDNAVGLPVFSAADGERLGTIGKIFIDPAQKRVVGFAIDTGGGFFEPEWAPKVDAANVQSLGPDALMLADKSALRGDDTEERYGTLVELGQLLHRRALTVDGVEEGTITSMRFDERTFALTAIEVGRGGHFRRRSTETVPVDDILVIGPDYAIIDRPPAEAGGADPVPAAVDEAAAQEASTA